MLFRRKTVWSLIAKHLHSEASPEDAEKLKKWLGKSQKNKLLYDQIAHDWNILEENKKMESFDVDTAWKKVKAKIQTDAKLSPGYLKVNTRSSGIVYIRYLKIAAVLVLGVFISYGTYWVIKSKRPARQQLMVKSEGTGLMETTLPDGSQVTLNTNSRIKYYSNGNKIRKVELKGEAFFNVKYDSQKPFLVIAENARIEVLGTSFNVYTDLKNKNVEVYVLSGSVQISRDGYDDNILMVEPGHIGILSSKDLISQINRDTNYMSWKTREFTFKETTLDDVINSVNRAYRSDISISNPDIKNCRLTANFKDESLEAIIEVLCTAFNLETRKRGSQIILDGPGC